MFLNIRLKMKKFHQIHKELERAIGKSLLYLNLLMVKAFCCLSIGMETWAIIGINAQI